MFGFGVQMLLRPLAFSKAIYTFSEIPWFHIFEITSRLLLGIIFIVLAVQNEHSKILLVLGSLLCFVALFLITIGEKRHRKFAKLISTIGSKFRILGAISIVLGTTVIYLGVKSVSS